MKIFFLLVITFYVSACVGQGQLYKTTFGKISFVSKAPKETIKAYNSSLAGVLNVETKNFSFKVVMKNFDGFNSPLQREHFHENYMETEEFPEATFVGKIIDPLQKDKNHTVRAKGILTIHGVSNEILISIKINTLKVDYAFETNFNVVLEDYKINIPRLVNQKLAKSLNINVNGVLKLQD